MAPKINCFYVHLMAAIPAERHFGFVAVFLAGLTFGFILFPCFYFSYFSSFYSYLFFLNLLFFLFSLFICLFIILFIICGLFVAVCGVSSSVGWLIRLNVKLSIALSQPSPICKLYVFSALMCVVPCPSFFHFPCFSIFIFIFFIF